jgi:hypothetical protein
MPTYPLTMPTTPAPSQCTISLKRAVAVAESPFTGQQQTIVYPYELWTAVIQLPPMRRDKAAEWQSFFMQLRGRRGTFLMGDPDAVTPRGTARTVTVSSGTVRENTISLNANGSILNGDYLQLSSGGASRLHMIVAGGNSGNAIYTIEPALKATYASGTAVTVVNARGLWRLDSNETGWDADKASVYGFAFSCTEAF